MQFFLCPTSMQYGVHTISALCDDCLQGYILLRNTCADTGLKPNKDCSGLGRAVAAFAHHHLSCQFTSRPEALLDISGTRLPVTYDLRQVCMTSSRSSLLAQFCYLHPTITDAWPATACLLHHRTEVHSLPVALQDRSVLMLEHRIWGKGQQLRGTH